MEFKYDGGGPAKGGDITLYVDGMLWAQAGSTRPCRCPSPQTRRVTSDGDRLARVVGLRSRGERVHGDVNWVQFDLEQDDHDHLVTPEERFRVVMARQ